MLRNLHYTWSKFVFENFSIDSYLDVTIDQPIQLEVFIVIAEGIYQLLGYLQQSHEEEELQNCEDRKVLIYLQLEWLRAAVDILSADQGDPEETVSGERHHLSVHQGDRHPVVAPQKTALGAKLVEFLQSSD